MKIIIETIPNKKQVYPTTGDWRWDNKDTLHIYVSKMGNWKYEMAIAYHEMREALVCKHRGIKQKDVDVFDIAFEKARLPGDEREPGDQPDAPYYIPHQQATRDEIMLIHDLGEKWDDYEKTVNNL